MLWLISALLCRHRGSSRGLSHLWVKLSPPKSGCRILPPTETRGLLATCKRLSPPRAVQGAPSRARACPLKAFLHRALPWQLLLQQMRSLSPPGTIRRRQLVLRGVPAPPNLPSASCPASPDPSSGSELGGPSVCLRLLETSSVPAWIPAASSRIAAGLPTSFPTDASTLSRGARSSCWGCWSWGLHASQMKPLAGTSPGEGDEEAQGPARGRRRRQRQRTSCQPSPSPQREQQAELAGLPTSPDEGRMSGSQGHPDGVLAGSEQSVGCIGEVPDRDRQELAVRTGDSDGTEEDAETPEDPLLSFPSELSVLERLGLHGVALTEQDVEAAFAHLALAFRCDMFTLRQRVEVEKRARDAAEENIQEELGQCRAALERLGPSCADVGYKEMLEQLQRSLAVLAAAIERATSAAEKLGAVHQEARMSRAAQVMVQHVENLKRHHLREHAELEEMKRLIQQNSRNRQLAETQDDAEPRLRPHPLMRTFQQGSARRRVSIAVIPKQLLPGASPDSRAALASETEREGSQRRPSTQRSELELQGQGSTVSRDPMAEADGRGSSAGDEEPEQLGLRSKGSPAELWRPWLFLPQHYWVFLWLLLLSIAFLLLIRVLELRRLQPVASPQA